MPSLSLLLCSISAWEARYLHVDEESSGKAPQAVRNKVPPVVPTEDASSCATREGGAGIGHVRLCPIQFCAREQHRRDGHCTSYFPSSDHSQYSCNCPSSRCLLNSHKHATCLSNRDQLKSAPRGTLPTRCDRTCRRKVSELRPGRVPSHVSMSESSP